MYKRQQKYTEKYGTESLNACAALYYDAIYMLLQAAENEMCIRDRAENGLHVVRLGAKQHHGQVFQKDAHGQCGNQGGHGPRCV